MMGTALGESSSCAQPRKLGEQFRIMNKLAEAQASFEKAIAVNNAKINNYRMQTLLRRLNEDIPPRAEEFIKNSYTSSEADQEELKTTIDKIIEKPDRKADLLKRFKLSRQ